MSDFYLNPSDKSGSATLSEGDSIITVADSSWRAARGFLSVPTKCYYELALLTGSNIAFGVSSAGASLEHPGSITGAGVTVYRNTGQVYNDGLLVATYSTYTSADRVQIAVDKTARKVWFGKNGTWNGDPAAGTGGLDIAWSGDIYPHVTCYSGSGRVHILASELAHSIPDGFSVWPLMYAFTGTIRDKNDALAARTVTSLREFDKTVVGTTTSDAVTGAYEIVTPYDEPHTLIFSGESDRNAIVYSGVMPS